MRQYITVAKALREVHRRIIVIICLINPMERPERDVLSCRSRNSPRIASCLSGNPERKMAYEFYQVSDVPHDFPYLPLDGELHDLEFEGRNPQHLLVEIHRQRV